MSEQFGSSFSSRPEAQGSNVGFRAVGNPADSVLYKDARIAALESQLAAAVRRAEEAERYVKVMCGHLSAVLDVATGDYIGNEGSEEEEIQSILDDADAAIERARGGSNGE